MGGREIQPITRGVSTSIGGSGGGNGEASPHRLSPEARLKSVTCAVDNATTRALPSGDVGEEQAVSVASTVSRRRGAPPSEDEGGAGDDAEERGGRPAATDKEEVWRRRRALLREFSFCFRGTTSAEIIGKKLQTVFCFCF